MIPQTASYPRPLIQAQFLAGIEFGMPGRNCANFGICRIHPLRWEDHDLPLYQGKALSLVSLYAYDYVELDFIRTSMEPAIFQKFLDRPEFLVLEDYHFPGTTEQNLRFCIKKGSYPIYQHPQRTKVVCRVTTQLESRLEQLLTCLD